MPQQSNNDTITIALLPLDIAWANCEENIRRVEAQLRTLRKSTDIVVLPELFSTGFIQDPSLLSDIAEKTSAKTLQYVISWAATHNAAFAGSYLCHDNGHILNRAFMVMPDGNTTFYDKRHLFCLSPEAKIFTPGNERPPVINFRGWNFSMVVCYDLRFPVWCRNRSMSYDVLLVPANWPTARGYAWKHLNIARAIENQAIVVGADRSGVDDYGDYTGMAMITDASGNVVAQAAGNDIIYGTFSKQTLQKNRLKLPFGNDADDFRLECKI